MFASPLATRPVPHRTAPGRPLPLWYSLLLAAPLTAATLYGLLAEHAYRTPADIAAQGRGQDLLTLLTVPVLLSAAGRARAGSPRAHLLWVGLMLYYVYSYLMYALATPYNDAFLAYLAVLALSGYGLLNGLIRIDRRLAAPALVARCRGERDMTDFAYVDPYWLHRVTGGPYPAPGDPA